MQVVANTNRLKARCMLGLLVIGFGVLSFGNAYAQSSRELGNRIERLEKEIETLNRALFRGEQPDTSSYSSGATEAARAQAEIRLSQMETELRNIRGQLEELNYENRQLREELERVKGDLELRIQDLENGRGGVSTKTNSGGAKYINRSPSVDDRREATPDDNSLSGYQWNSGQNDQPNQLGTYKESGTSGDLSASEDLASATYENAFSMLKNENYDVAQREFQVFLDEYPGHPLAGNAKYWLGETYYVRGDYEQAARLFAEGFKQYPKNSKSADNLLKLGMSLSALGKSDDACVALSQIEKEGYQASAPVLRRANQEKERLGC